MIKLIGVLIMALTASGAARFKLDSPQHYFGDTRTISLVNAALVGDIAKAKELVKEGANPNEEGHFENKHHHLRPLHYAIAAKNPQAVKILTGLGADPEMKTEGPGRPLMFAMTLDDVEMLSLFLDLKPIGTLSSEALKSLLFGSVSIPRPRCLELLLKRGAPIDLPDGAKETILMRAMDAQDYDMAEWLLQRGASVHVVAGGGVTPAYSVEFHLKKYKEGSPTYKKVLHLKEMMKERGAVFPALTPAEVRAKHGK